MAYDLRISYCAAALYFRQTIEIGIPDSALQNQIRTFSFACNFNQAGHLQFFYVMGNSCGAHMMGLQQNAAGHGIAACADLLENLIAPGLGQSAANQRKLPIG